MVLTPAPNSRRPDVNSHSGFQDNHWTLRFRKASASRMNRKTSLLTLASCVFLLPGSLSIRSEADQVNSKPAISSPAAPSTSTQSGLSPVVSQPTNSAVPSPATPSLAQSWSIVSKDGVLAIVDTPKTEATTDSKTATTPANSSQTLTPLNSTPASLPSSQSLSQPSSENSSAEQSSAPADKSLGVTAPGATAPLADSTASSPSPVTALAPAPSQDDAPTVSKPALPQAKPAEKSASVNPAKMRIRAIVSGKERQAQIAVTPKMTVGQALAAMGISLAALDRVTPDASALARDGLAIRVTRISAKIQKRRTPIAATELRYKPTTAIQAGAKQTIQEAKAGAMEITERVWTRDGKVTKREFVSKRVAVAPQHKIVALGVQAHLMPNNVRYHRRYASALSFRGGTPRDRMIAPADPSTFAPIKSLKVLATGYSAGPAGGAVSNWTATGVRCTYGAVAVDPRLIPLGSKLYIEGYGYGFACDTGGAIKGKHIDLAFNSPRAAFAHGKRQVKVWILGP